MASTPAASNRSIIIRLNIASEELLKLYRGSAREVVATSLDGQKIRFPAEALKPFVTHNGVQGQFTLLVDANNKLIDLRRY
ncbi:MAG: DUF2835 domain-containing protein [Cellvibrionales bacterium]|jgi:hypothetical protein|nr:DUF2835 domain-containing protein [Cellvibrionales bacterium]MBT6579414.1 DUF2835 domain-containing protein [Cellvibrionales bacterium]